MRIAINSSCQALSECGKVFERPRSILNMLIMLKITDKPTVVTEHSSLLGECALWDAKRKMIYWVDILSCEIHSYSTKEKIHEVIPVYQMIGSLAICTNGNFIAALQNGFAFINRVSGKVEIIADPENHLPNNRFNDGKCDPAGRFWAGTMSLSEEPEAGSLYAIEKDMCIKKKLKT